MVGRELPDLADHRGVHEVGGHSPVVAAVRRPSTYERWVKPVADRILALFLLVALSPLLVDVALAVRLSLGPGVIYRQDRVGLGGSIIRVLKFRTMRHDRRRDGTGRGRQDRRHDDRREMDRRNQQVAITGPERRRSERRGGERRQVELSRRLTHKTTADPRHTALGRVLRAFSLDELPQLFNVLKGDLSLVGPRPELPEVVATYEPWQHARHAVKPGLTGLWQVTERGDAEPMHLHVDTDLRYIEQLSPTTDLRILLATPLAVAGIGRRGRGS